MSRSQVTPIYPSPLFKLVPMDAPQMFANVSNSLEITHNGREYQKYVEVGTALFQALRVLKVEPESEVTMFLEDDGPRMLFGIVVDGEELHDLWHYTRDRVPQSLLTS